MTWQQLQTTNSNGTKTFCFVWLFFSFAFAHAFAKRLLTHTQLYAIPSMNKYSNLLQHASNTYNTVSSRAHGLGTFINVKVNSIDR